MTKPRYVPEWDPEGANPVFPWIIRDTLEEGRDGIQGPAFSARDAALLAWALNHRSELMENSSELRTLVDECVSYSA